MEEKINIAEILKNKPQGTKLYDLLYNIDVELDTISTTDTETVVWCTNETDNNTTCHRGYSEFGTVRGCSDGLQILLPSKDMRDWRKFDWKKGDVLISNDGKKEVFFNGFTDDTYALFKAKHGFEILSDGNTIYLADEDGIATSDYTLEDKDATQTYIKTIEERLGGKLNRETLEVEKSQPEFKDGDIVFMKGIKSELFANCIFILRSEYKDGDERAFYYAFYNVDDKYTLDEYGNTKVHYSLRSATDSEKQQLFDALSKKGKRWDAEKKEIVDLPKKYEFKPFDKCVWKIQGIEGSIWQASFISYVDEYGAVPMSVSIDDLSNLIILPYNEETAHLLGTTDEWKGGGA